MPTPSSLESASVPPIDSTRPRASASPSPVPSIPRLGSVEALERREQAADRLLGDAGAGVGDLDPHSRPSVRPALITTLPPRRLYLTALESRLSSTWIRR